MKVEGWAIVMENGHVEFYSHLPNHITTANSYHMYKAVLTYRDDKKPRKTKGTRKK